MQKIALGLARLAKENVLIEISMAEKIITYHWKAISMLVIMVQTISKYKFDCSRYHKK